MLDEDEVRRCPCGDALESRADHPAPPTHDHSASDDELAYSLYLGIDRSPEGRDAHASQRNLVRGMVLAMCSRPKDDRVSSHAPLHFDLSILDLYMTLGCGHARARSRVHRKDPRASRAVHRRTAYLRLVLAPSILALLAQYGDAQRDYAALRLVLFAGEVFPVKHLRALKALLPRPATTTCTDRRRRTSARIFASRTTIPRGPHTAIPDRQTLSSTRRWSLLRTGGKPAAAGTEGDELIARGPAVTRGYWNLPERTAEAFHVDSTASAGTRRATWSSNLRRQLRFLGRRDRMIKKRGYRIELGEIEPVCTGIRRSARSV